MCFQSNSGSEKGENKNIWTSPCIKKNKHHLFGVRRRALGPSGATRKGIKQKNRCENLRENTRARQVNNIATKNGGGE